jgi:dTDP-4-amino-4,6-dideoxygalactose transaminase
VFAPQNKVQMTNIPLIDVLAQYKSLKPEIRQAIDDVLDSGQYIMGPDHQRFENEFGDWIGAAGAVGVSSGTAALQLALLAAGVGPGDEVITTPFTFFATAEMIAQVGATPVFADIEQDSFNIDPDSVAKVMTSRTKAVIPVHLFGSVADVPRIREITAHQDIAIIEDAAQAHGAELDGIKAGSLGDLACFSFFPSKNLSCFGDGGMVTSNSAHYLERVRKLRNHGRSARYMHDELGWGHRLDTIQAATLSVKLKHLSNWSARRREIAARYQEHFSDVESVQTPDRRTGNEHVFHAYTLKVPDRDKLQAHLNDANIGSAIYYPIGLHEQPALDYLGYATEDFPVTAQLSKQVISIPIYPEMTNSQIDAVVDAIKAHYS